MNPKHFVASLRPNPLVPFVVIGWVPKMKSNTGDQNGSDRQIWSAGEARLTVTVERNVQRNQSACAVSHTMNRMVN